MILINVMNRKICIGRYKYPKNWEDIVLFLHNRSMIV